MMKMKIYFDLKKLKTKYHFTIPKQGKRNKSSQKCLSYYTPKPLRGYIIY